MTTTVEIGSWVAVDEKGSWQGRVEMIKGRWATVRGRWGCDEVQLSRLTKV